MKVELSKEKNAIILRVKNYGEPIPQDQQDKIFKHLAKDENKCVIIVTHSQNVCDSVDVVYELNKKK